MAEVSTFARPYAEALFQVARDSNMLGEWSELLGRMAVVARNPDMAVIVADPNVNSKQVFDIFSAAVGDVLSDEGKNLLQALIDNGRIGVLESISQQFNELKNAHEGAADAEIVSAFELSGSQLAELVSLMEKRFGVRLKPHVSVDNSLIGGVRVSVGDRTVDTSVRAQLAGMQVALSG